MELSNVTFQETYSEQQGKKQKSVSHCFHMGLCVVLGKPHAIALWIREILEPDPENMSHSTSK